MPPANSSRRPPRRSGNGFWLVAALAIGGVAAVYVFAPNVVRQIFGGGDTAPSGGEEPALTQATQTDLGSRTSDSTNLLTAPSTVSRTATSATPIAKPTETASVTSAPKYKDEAQAQQFLGEAETAYKAAPGLGDWSKAVSAARKITSLDAKPATIVRAKDIIRGSEAMAKLFKELDDRDELARNYDTSPSLVSLTGSNATPSYAVPIRSMEDPSVVDGDPVAYLQSQRRTGSVTVLLKGRKDFIPAKLPADQLGKVEKADVATAIAERKTEFEERLARLKNSDLARNPLAWYDAAKFAYQNRLDEYVSEMMDKALILDPLLAGSVREDKAGGIFANIVLHLNNNNTKQAAAFMAMMDRRFSDTPSGQQARAFYDLKTKKDAGEIAAAQTRLKAARDEARAKAAEDATRRRDDRIARAKQLGDAEAVAEAEKFSDPEDAGSTQIGAAPVSGDEGKADELYAQGRDIYQKAQEAGNSSNRDDLYGEANKYLTQAQNIYNNLLEKSPNPALEEKAFMCNKLRYGSIKQRRFH